jgi:hypothetical protein
LLFVYLVAELLRAWNGLLWWSLILGYSSATYQPLENTKYYLNLAHVCCD